MNLLHILNEVVFAAVEGFISLMLFVILTERTDFVNRQRIKAGCFIAFYTLFSYWATLYTPPGIHTILIALFLVVSLGYIVRTNIYTAAIAVALSFVFVILTEIITAVPLLLILKADITVLNSPGIRLLGIVICRSIQLLGVYLLYRTRLQLFCFKVFKKENSVLAFGVFQTFMVIIIMTSVVFVTTHEVNLALYQILVMCVLLLVIIVNFFDYAEREKILRQKNKLELQEEHVKNLEASVNMVRRERHDYANHLNTLLAMCTLRKADTLDTVQDYVERLVTDLKTNYQAYNSGNEYVDGLLAVKGSEANEKGISLDVNFMTPLSALSFSGTDLVSILGNLIDNAMEALLTVPEKSGKNIFITSRMQNNMLTLSIANSGPEIPEKIMDRLFENGVTTKREKQEHGFGLSIVKQLVEKNGGSVHASSTREETVFKVQFPVGQESKSHIA